MTTNKRSGHSGSRRDREAQSSSSSDRAKKAAQTRKEHDPEAFKKMGEKGGKSGGSHS